MTPVPEKILWLVSRNLLEFSGKGYEQLFDGPFNRPDVQNAIACGKLMKKERDETGVAKYKYTIIGPHSTANRCIVAAKFARKVQAKSTLSSPFTVQTYEKKLQNSDTAYGRALPHVRQRNHAHAEA